MKSDLLEAPFSNLQHELLKLYSMDVSEEELMDIKHLIGVYFMQRASKEASKIWEEKGYDDETLKNILNE